MFIKDKIDFANKLNIPLKYLTSLLLENIDNFYSTFYIPKKDGTTRTINAPNSKLKLVQKRLSDLLYEKEMEIWKDLNIKPNISHGFEKEKSIITNAKIHKNKKFVLNIDLKDFFKSFHFGRVRGYFHKNKYFALDMDIAIILANLCCYNGSLPQGAPTSPIISNLICQILDFRLLSISKKYRLDYTRYADDLTFSTNHKDFIKVEKKFLKEVKRIVEKSGFEINNKKTKLQYRNSKQIVTGLVVNKMINVDKKYYRTTKAMAHSLYTNGEFYIDGEIGTINQLEGRFSFINQLVKYNYYNNENKMTNFNLKGRSREYQKFLFYKYFLNNSKPLIITEGITDTQYLKAALKKNYKEYPNLIKKHGERFEYSISFFRRSNEMKEYFGIVDNGADTLNNIYKYYIGGKINSNKCTNYFDIFSRYKTKIINPVIILLDNESKTNSKKPLTKFCGYTNMPEETKIKLTKHNEIIKLIDNSNLYLIVPPLVAGKDECEIEDLFDDDIWPNENDNKGFFKEVSKNKTEYRNKKNFANYIDINWQETNFSGFIPLLNNINNIVSEYL